MTHDCASLEKIRFDIRSPSPPLPFTTQRHLPRGHHLHPRKQPPHRNPYLLESGCHLPPTNECFVAYVNPLLVYHHLCFKAPEDGRHAYHASCGA